MNRFVVRRAAGMFELMFKLDVGFPVSRHNLDFSVTLSIASEHLISYRLMLLCWLFVHLLEDKSSSYRHWTKVDINASIYDKMSEAH
jgi:hypothetical protein